ncbi:MAG: helix-turn-helix transcriptional regulator [Clostridiales bacterium]|nr:helix-turn-helix transcriptional regulator [Clostridiales bacterium]
MTVLEKIDKLRKARGWSINNLAMEAMLTQSTLNNLYTRKNDPKISTLQAICNAFGITLSEFFAEDAEKTSALTVDERLQKKIASLSNAQKSALLEFLKTL